LDLKNQNYQLIYHFSFYRSFKNPLKYESYPCKEVVMNEVPVIDVQNIGHLGLIAAIAEKYKIVDIIDKLLPKVGNNQNLSHGQVVLAMIYQGLGLSYDRIYLAEKFFENLPLENLFSPGIEGKDFK